MTVAESPPSSSSFSMDDVTSKIAYAYAKQQVFVLLALVGAVTGALLILEEWPSSSGDTYLGLVDDVILLLGSVGILALVFTQRDLKRINRHAVAVLGVLLLIKVLVVALSAGGLYRVEDSADLGDDVGIPIVLGLALASYPFPVRKGGKNLFAPADIRALSNARTLVFAALVAAVAS
ncbi:MAG: hypothetical protein KGI98_16740, partial [Euryarchaeota archaeon]|nr:hypothetical protein [Euryarchaeota archaeon]